MFHKFFIYVLYLEIYAHTLAPAWLNDTKFAPHGASGNGAPVFQSEEGGMYLYHGPYCEAGHVGTRWYLMLGDHLELYDYNYIHIIIIISLGFKGNGEFYSQELASQESNAMYRGLLHGLHGLSGSYKAVIEVV